MNKLEGFPSIYYLSLGESQDRRQFLFNQFYEYDIKNFTGIISKRFAECDDVVEGNYVDTLTDQSKGSLVSHIKALDHWLKNTNEEYVFICEDDLSFETVKYWDFTWKDFINNLPKNWDIVQLLVVRDDFENKFEFRSRYWNDWALAAYIIRRDYAQKIVNKYYVNEKYIFNVDSNGHILQPIGENVMYIPSENAYSIPLFVEEVYKFNTTLIGVDNFDGNKDGFEMLEGQGKSHITSYHDVINWYKSNKKVTLQKLKMNQNEVCELLNDYVYDTENAQKNFDLARWYHNQGQTAAAISFYLRAADRTDNPVLAYECLLLMASCFDTQGGRDQTVRGLYQHAISTCPERPEAYFLLAKFDEYRKNYSECYKNCTIALRFCNFDLDELSVDVDYPGKYGLLFEKAISAYWWGKNEECKSILINLVKNYSMKENYKEIVMNNLKNMNMNINVDFLLDESKSKFTFNDSFDWSELTYDDIVTIDREIIHEQVYRFWRDVKENDVVVDIGASVGPFVCSILPNKPQKVYCVEPSKTLLKTLAKNCTEYLIDYKENPLIYVNHAIIDESIDEVNIFGNYDNFTGITFKNLIDDYDIQKINFLKIDCEGGEYNVFKDENMDFLLHKVEFIAMETHLNYPGCREKFKNFRDKYLVQFDNFKVMSCTRQNISWGESLDIKDRIFDNDFVDNYTCEFMIYISRT